MITLFDKTAGIDRREELQALHVSNALPDELNHPASARLFNMLPD
ncbi:MAG: hypothetical protein PHH36_13800 [Sideroxydans sp.]|jgi:hypothetical protein|nr:hypothetical protein [Sideroxydans sp.]